MTPRDRVQELQKAADALYASAFCAETAAIRLALEASDWLEARAAALLEIPRTTLRTLLQGRHRGLGEEARKRRAKRGYKGGNPKVGEGSRKVTR